MSPGSWFGALGSCGIRITSVPQKIFFFRACVCHLDFC